VAPPPVKHARPGACIFIGNGAGEGACMLHNLRYDFNDEILTLGASYWASLAEQELDTLEAAIPR
jgi:metal-dependent amidase/aminoacylase/carboxypeptidase family protein